eukprot:m.77087 g.77087  ORF g.77087 m.77087 type:complete len:117 (-) comp17263_c0_seq4:2217-2567(-)
MGKKKGKGAHGKQDSKPDKKHERVTRAELRRQRKKEKYIQKGDKEFDQFQVQLGVSFFVRGKADSASFGSELLGLLRRNWDCALWMSLGMAIACSDPSRTSCSETATTTTNCARTL